MNENLIVFLKNKDVEYYPQAYVGNFSSIKCGGSVFCYICPSDLSNLYEVVSFLENEKIAYKVVGKMTNLLVQDGANDIVLVDCNKINIKNRAENTIYVECGASITSVVMEMAKEGYGGASGLAGIPGTVGGAVYNNAGAFGSEISDIFIRGDFFSKKEGKIVCLTREDLKFSYRNSHLKGEEYIFLNGTLGFHKADKQIVLNEITEFNRKRALSQPKDYPSLGSVFKRYNGISAGYYIEKAGLKGFHIGGAEISKKHAGFIINTGNATSSDVISLIKLVKEKVFDRFNILLEEEICII